MITAVTIDVYQSFILINTLFPMLFIQSSIVTGKFITPIPIINNYQTFVNENHSKDINFLEKCFFRNLAI